MSITAIQVVVMQKIQEYWTVRRYFGPTYEELGESLGVSRPTIFEHVSHLREKGLVAPKRGVPHDIKLTTKGHEIMCPGLTY